MLRINVAYSERDLVTLQAMAREAEPATPRRSCSPRRSECSGRTAWSPGMNLQIAELTEQIAMLRRSETFPMWKSPENSSESIQQVERARPRPAQPRKRTGWTRRSSTTTASSAAAGCRTSPSSASTLAPPANDHEPTDHPPPGAGRRGRRPERADPPLQAITRLQRQLHGPVHGFRRHGDHARVDCPEPGHGGRSTARWLASRTSSRSTSRDAVCLEDLFIEPDAQGEGVGGALFDRALATAAEQGHDWLGMGIGPNAAGFYEKMGGEKIGETKSTIIEGRVLPMYRMPTAAITSTMPQRSTRPTSTRRQPVTQVVWEIGPS